MRKVPWNRKWQLAPVFLPWKIPWTEEPGRLQSMGSQRVGQDWVTKHSHTQNWVPCLLGRREMEKRGKGGDKREQGRQSSVQDSMLQMQGPQVWLLTMKLISHMLQDMARGGKKGAEWTAWVHTWRIANPVPSFLALRSSKIIAIMPASWFSKCFTCICFSWSCFQLQHQWRALSSFHRYSSPNKLSDVLTKATCI